MCKNWNWYLFPVQYSTRLLWSLHDSYEWWILKISINEKFQYFCNYSLSLSIYILFQLCFTLFQCNCKMERKVSFRSRGVTNRVRSRDVWAEKVNWLRVIDCDFWMYLRTKLLGVCVCNMCRDNDVVVTILTRSDVQRYSDLAWLFWNMIAIIPKICCLNIFNNSYPPFHSTLCLWKRYLDSVLCGSVRGDGEMCIPLWNFREATNHVARTVKSVVEWSFGNSMVYGKVSAIELLWQSAAKKLKIHGFCKSVKLLTCHLSASRQTIVALKF